jgi:hypothetical protein
MFSISVGAESTAQEASQPAVHQVPINFALQPRFSEEGRRTLSRTSGNRLTKQGAGIAIISCLIFHMVFFVLFDELFCASPMRGMSEELLHLANYQ